MERCDPMIQTNFANMIIASAGLVLGILGLLQTLITKYLKKGTRKYFAVIFGIIILYLLSILGRELARVGSGYEWAVLSRSTLFAQALLSSLFPMVVMFFLLDQSREDSIKDFVISTISCLIWFFYVGLLIYNQYSGMMYRVDDSNNYTRGPAFFMLMVSPVIIMTINLFILWQKRDMLSKKQQAAFFIYDTIPMAAVILQLFSHGIMLIMAGVVVAALVMLSYIASDQQEEYYRQKIENEKLKNEILLAQINPHFMFNSLSAVRYLVREDPKKAREAIDQFTSYLRDHMDSITVDSPIPFMDELKLVEEYLSLQKLRFGDALNVVYEFGHTDFKVPTLTIQPVVENAVTHGIRQSKNGSGTVTIRTLKADDHVEIIIEDDGAGFDPEARYEDSKRSHNGIENVKKRLKLVSGGELFIESKPGSGTKATIVIPDL